MTGPPDPAIAFEVGKLRVREAARSILSAEKSEAVVLPTPIRLDEFLAEPDAPVTYRVTGLMPIGARVMVAASAKSGKTTLLVNLLRSLADGEPFLGLFQTRTADRIVLVDDEMTTDMLRRWMREAGIVHPERITLVSLRDRVGAFNIIDAATRTRWAKLIGPADVLVIDCLRPILDALGLAENHEAGRFLDAFDALRDEAGIGEGVLSHHTGHGGERARGDSRLGDWPDATWKLLLREGDETSTRYFSALGRDVDVTEARLEFHVESRRLALVGGNRRDALAAASVEAALQGVLVHLDNVDKPVSQRFILDAMVGGEFGRPTLLAAIASGITDLKILTEDGPRNSKLHYLNPSI
jgi:hypothetical protein